MGMYFYNIDKPGDQRRKRGMNRGDHRKAGLHQPPLFREVAELQLHQPMAVLAQGEAVFAGKAYRLSVRQRRQQGVDVIALNRRGEILLLAERCQHFSHPRRQIGRGKGVAQHLLNSHRPALRQGMVGMTDEETALRAERLDPQLRIQLRMPAVGHHEGKLLGRQRVMQGKPVIDLKTHPRLR